MKRITILTLLSFGILSAWAAGPVDEAYGGTQKGEPLIISVGQIIGLTSYAPTMMTIGEKGLVYKNETMKEAATLPWDDIVQWRFFVPKLVEPDDLTKDFYMLTVSTKAPAGKERVHFVFSGTVAEAWELQRTLRKLEPGRGAEGQGHVGSLDSSRGETHG